MIFDILSSDIAVAGAAEVVVNTAAKEVSVSGPGVGGLDFFNSNGFEWFSGGDNLILTGLWVNIPFGLGQGTGQAKIGIGWKDAGGTVTPIPELAGSALTLPNICRLDFPPDGLFLTAPTGSGKIRLNLVTISLDVSMLNVPAAIDGDTLKVQFHLRGFHTKILTAAP